MSWRRRLRDIAVAGGLAGCASQSMGGTTTSTTTGSGGATTSATGMGGYMGPVCNANPDPCCQCAPNYPMGGFGGAACVNATKLIVGDAGVSCSDELACIQAPTKACCDALGIAAQVGIAAAACADAGPGPEDAGSD